MMGISWEGERIERTEGRWCPVCSRPSADRAKSKDSVMVFCAVGRSLESFPMMLFGV